MPVLVGYVLLFVAVGVGFILIHLVAGKLLRPNRPDAEKMTIYECGEPTIGSAWVQFDLRFYVVALLFVIFDVEVAFFFPWAVVFGKTNMLAHDASNAERVTLTVGDTSADGKVSNQPLVPPYPENVRPSQEFRDSLKEGASPGSQAKAIENNREAARQFGWIAFCDILVFFGVLLVGFAYLWKRGDLDWVRSTAAERAEVPVQEPAETVVREPLVGARS
ncbi:MAG: NADH-quinone oxidoreductase subunit A [Gemmataceae bacterium]|nr:NADH-quinone oxidoreductase subunit A [Gemmataceae bacterium]